MSRLNKYLRATCVTDKRNLKLKSILVSKLLKKNLNVDKFETELKKIWSQRLTNLSNTTGIEEQNDPDESAAKWTSTDFQRYYKFINEKLHSGHSEAWCTQLEQKSPLLSQLYMFGVTVVPKQNVKITTELSLSPNGKSLVHTRKAAEIPFCLEKPYKDFMGEMTTFFLRKWKKGDGEKKDDTASIITKENSGIFRIHFNDFLRDFRMKMLKGKSANFTFLQEKCKLRLVLIDFGICCVEPGNAKLMRGKRNEVTKSEDLLGKTVTVFIPFKEMSNINGCAAFCLGSHLPLEKQNELQTLMTHTNLKIGQYIQTTLKADELLVVTDDVTHFLTVNETCQRMDLLFYTLQWCKVDNVKAIASAKNLGNSVHDFDWICDFFSFHEWHDKNARSFRDSIQKYQDKCEHKHSNVVIKDETNNIISSKEFKALLQNLFSGDAENLKYLKFCENGQQIRKFIRETKAELQSFVYNFVFNGVGLMSQSFNSTNIYTAKSIYEIYYKKLTAYMRSHNCKRTDTLRELPLTPNFQTFPEFVFRADPKISDWRQCTLDLSLKLGAVKCGLLENILNQNESVLLLRALYKRVFPDQNLELVNIGFFQTTMNSPAQNWHPDLVINKTKKITLCKVITVIVSLVKQECDALHTNGSTVLELRSHYSPSEKSACSRKIVQPVLSLGDVVCWGGNLRHYGGAYNYISVEQQKERVLMYGVLHLLSQEQSDNPEYLLEDVNIANAVKSLSYFKSGQKLEIVRKTTGSETKFMFQE